MWPSMRAEAAARNRAVRRGNQKEDDGNQTAILIMV